MLWFYGLKNNEDPLQVLFFFYFIHSINVCHVTLKFCVHPFKNMVLSKYIDLLYFAY
jgi:hypothetical protein